MNTSIKTLIMAAALAVSVSIAYAADTHVKLLGKQEVPAVDSSAKGTATFTIGADKSVSGSIKTTGIAGTVAHIHLAAIGQNGPPIITLTKTSDDEWSVPAGAKLTDDQLAAYNAGNLYVNVHSKAHAAGEIRGQLLP